MKFFRKHKAISITIICIIFLLLFSFTTYGRYIRNILNNYILETKAFYFNSSVLAVNGKNFSISNWDGVNSYTLTIDLNNRKNEERHTMADIYYSIDVKCPSTVQCTLSKTSGIIRSTESTDTYQIVISPIGSFKEGESVVVETSVTSSSPYKKTLSAKYSIGVAKSDFGYEIVDSENAKYLNIKFTNSISYYQVSEAFGSYNIGDKIPLDEYKLLSDNDKEKCFSAIVTVEFDPKKIFLDMTNDSYINRLPTNYEEVTIDGFKWVSKFSFKVNASSSNTILFYKDDIKKNYTYPIVNSESIIKVSVELAN